MKIKWTFLLVGIVAFGCEQLAPKVSYTSPLAGKLRTITIVNDSTYRVEAEYKFYYDSVSGELIKMKRDKDDSVELYKINGKTIKLAYHYLDSLSGIHSDFDLYAYINDQNYISSISYAYPENTDPDLNLYRFVFKPDNTIDTIIEPFVPTPDYIFYNKDFDIVSDARNYVQLKIFTNIHHTTGFPITDTTTRVIDFVYATCSSTVPMPEQSIFSMISFSGWYLDAMDPVYILNIAGFQAYKPNRNMIDSVMGCKYTYAFNTNQQVTEIRRSCRPKDLYQMTYY